MQNVAGYAVAAVAIVTVGLVLVFGDPRDAGAWAPIIVAVVAGLPGLVAVFQNGNASAQIDQHDRKLEDLRTEVNGAQRAALHTAVIEAEKAGRNEVLAQLPDDLRPVDRQDAHPMENLPQHDAP